MRVAMKKMKRMTKRILTVALLMLFTLTFVFSGTEWMFVEAFSPVNYLEDVRLYKAHSKKDAQKECEADGFTFVPYDLNDGTMKTVQVYLGYTTTTNRDFAITSLAMLGMNSGYQLRDYKEIAQVMGITEQQVKVNIFRARQSIKQRFIQLEQHGL